MGLPRPELNTYVADLHVHTVLSPCAGVEMIPPLIIRQVQAQRIQLIAITDHNASANVAAVQAAAAGAAGRGVAVLPGMELQTHEEVHLLCLFDTLAQLEEWQAIVDSRMPALENVPDYLGEQFVVDETGEFIRRETRLLATSSEITLQEAVAVVSGLGGLAIPAHVDRPVFSLFANLGFVPRGVAIEAMEISRYTTPFTARARFPQLAHYPLIQSGDAHYLDELSGATVFTLAAPTVGEIRLALRGHQGRGARITA